MLASNWGIGIETAKRTLKVTTYRGLRMVPHPTLSRRLQLTDSHSIVDSLLICLLIFCFLWNSHHFREINALKSFGLRMVGSGISLCFSSMKVWHHNGYGWCFKTGAIPICHGRMLLNPPFVSWSADLDAKWSGLAPQILSDHCLERESYIRSHTTLDIFSLNG